MAPRKRKAAPEKEETSSELVPKKSKSGLGKGDPFPELGDFLTDKSTDDSEVKLNLKDVLKEHGVVIFFYPKANTGGCTKQACGFNDNLEKFESKGYKIFGMSADKPKTQANWKKKYGLQYTILSDPTLEALQILGVARGSKGINRSHIVVEKGGKIIDIKVGISPTESFSQAIKTVVGK